MNKCIKFSFLLTAILLSTVALAQNTMFDICPLKVGSEIPSTALKNANNEVVYMDSLTNVQPTVLIFYRGAWCSYCTKHLAALNDIKKDIEDAGYQIFGITMDQPSKLDESKERSKSEIEVYADVKAEAIKTFGLNWTVDDTLFTKYKNEYKIDLELWSGESHHQLPVPAVFVIKDGIVQFQYVNPTYSTRLKPETLLAVLKTI